VTGQKKKAAPLPGRPLLVRRHTLPTFRTGNQLLLPIACPDLFIA
jgi:hypothetical protein